MNQQQKSSIPKERIGILIVLWIVFIGIVTFLAMQTGTGRWDFITYHYNAERLVAGEALYSGFTARYDYIYPPLLAQVIAPLTPLLDLDGISMAWHILSLILLVMSIWMINQEVDNPRRRWMFWLVPVLFIPNYQSMWVGQISMVLLGLFTSAWYAYKHNRPYVTGVVLALATWLKVYPIFLIGYFIWKRDWKVTLSAFIAGMLLLGFQIFITDSETILTYFFEILPGLANEGQIVGLFKNSSILGFTFKVFIETPDVIPLVDSAMLANISRWGLTAIVVGTSLFLISRPQTPQKNEFDNSRFDLEYGLVVLVSLLFASTLWVSGMPPLILCYLLILKQHLPLAVRRWVWVSFGIVAFYFVFLLAFQVGNKLPWTILSMGFYGVFGLWLINIKILNNTIKER